MWWSVVRMKFMKKNYTEALKQKCCHQNGTNKKIRVPDKIWTHGLPDTGWSGRAWRQLAEI